MVGGLLGEVGDAACLEGLVQAPGVVRDEDEPAQAGDAKLAAATETKGADCACEETEKAVVKK